jgi:hypothetical protein
MTIAELRAQIGATDDGLLRYFRGEGAHHVTAWTGAVSGQRGWWWALTTACGDHEIIVAMGWSAGTRQVDRDADIARKLAGLQSPAARSLAS